MVGSKYFKIQELFHPEIIKNIKNTNILWRQLDDRVVEGISYIRDTLQIPIIVNNYHVGGVLKNRGLRPENTTVGGKFGQHKKGRAIDFHSPNMSIPDLHEWCLNDVNLLQFFTRIEDISFTPTWIHLDCAYMDIRKSLYIMQPSRDVDEQREDEIILN